jgi:hypothetical protein
VYAKFRSRPSAVIQADAANRPLFGQSGSWRFDEKVIGVSDLSDRSRKI